MAEQRPTAGGEASTAGAGRHGTGGRYGEQTGTRCGPRAAGTVTSMQGACSPKWGPHPSCFRSGLAEGVGRAEAGGRPPDQGLCPVRQRLVKLGAAPRAERDILTGRGGGGTGAGPGTGRGPTQLSHSPESWRSAGKPRDPQARQSSDPGSCGRSLSLVSLLSPADAPCCIRLGWVTRRSDSSLRHSAHECGSRPSPYKATAALPTVLCRRYPSPPRLTHSTPGSLYSQPLHPFCLTLLLLNLFYYNMT